MPLFLTACATTSGSRLPENTKFFAGRAEIFDKRKNKNERIHFYAAASSPDLLRIEVTAGMLNVPLGTLVLRGSEAQFVNLIEGKDYRSEDGSRALERLLKTKITPRQLVALFSEDFPLPQPWQCRRQFADQMKCENVDLFLDWQKDDKNRQLNIESEKSTINMKYSEDKRRNVNFEWLSPRGFEKVTL